MCPNYVYPLIIIKAALLKIFVENKLLTYLLTYLNKCSFQIFYYQEKSKFSPQLVKLNVLEGSVVPEKGQRH